MMGIFDRQKRFVDEFEQSLKTEFESTINMFGFVLEDYITNKQLFRKGIDGDGKKLEGYKRTTIRLKLRKGQPIDRTTLLDENEFHPSIQIDAFSDRFEISSDVNHAKYIIKRYGRNVLKVTRENMEEFMKNYYLPNLKKTKNDRFAK